MPAALQLGFAQPHEEAIAFLRGKPVVTRAVFDRLLPELRARAFTVTGIDEFDRLQRIRDVISVLPAGATWDETKAEVVAQLDALGEGAERRAELLMRTHGFQAFQAANWNVAQADTDTTHLQYLATEDDRVRDTHLALNGIIVPKDDSFWNRHYPPWEWGCRCRVRPINPDLLQEARERDAGFPPEKALVIDGPALQRLRDGQIIRDNRSFDVTSPADRPGGETAFQWSPGDLHLDAAKLESRYDPDVWAQWKGWAETTEVRPGTTVWEWLQGGRRPSAVPATPPSPAPAPPPAPATIPPEIVDAKSRLEAAGFSAARAAALDRTPAPVAPHLASVGFQASPGGASYSPSTKTVKWGSDGSAWGGHPMSLHHELGHHLHSELNLITASVVDASITGAAKVDFAGWKKWANGVSADWAVMFKHGAYRQDARSAVAKALGVVGGEFKTDPLGAKRIARALDTIMAVSKGRYGEGHPLAYMKRPNRALMEAFANTYSAIVDGDSAFQTMFPELTKAVKKLLGL